MAPPSQSATPLVVVTQPREPGFFTDPITSRCSTGEYNLPTPSPVSLSGTSSTFAALLSPFFSGKLADAAPGGDAASTTDPANPLLTLPTEDNLLAVEIDGVPVNALIDTGAHISVMSAQLRSRLRKVLTPALSHVRVADGGTSAVAGMCTARVSIAGHPVTVMFFVLDKCPHDVILGRDFLSDHSALIDCSTGLLRLELPLSSDDHAPPFLHLRSDEHVRLPPQAATYVPLSSSMPVPDGDYVVAPVLDVLLTRNVALPHTIVSIQQNHVSLPFLNFAFHTQVLPQGMTVATVCPVSDFHISAFTVNTISHPPTSSATPPPTTQFDAMISPDLSPDQIHLLRQLLASYGDIFDLENPVLGRTSLVTHRIDTGDAIPIHRRPYRGVPQVLRRDAGAPALLLTPKDDRAPALQRLGLPSHNLEDLHFPRSTDGILREVLLHLMTHLEATELPRGEGGLAAASTTAMVRWQLMAEAVL
ncbi:uncharacterized protein LOC144162635 [Haemaphysalis longicornis]